jgi:hypothetical protein
VVPPGPRANGLCVYADPAQPIVVDLQR